ncbi:hypothetical protein SSBR45G_03170 [Bradyrhizobium sp. SSBR45G]|uniref:hypothetical protein n=1 Tax=unclassified Bradyrhizobium TaxID=2631580 RepID=UPI002342A2EB|nr:MULTISPECIES: hypothetical protein [unclassified Bradyrhizobium]GLH75409.1 hypothetical protein SSBR45G_03170 [Bradyrhizobium sp. SSBR45G]GLH82804.1 hypothetical protein SSBR45R_02640 [Bradyrhizobium sp. SSBR45R]
MSEWLTTYWPAILVGAVFGTLFSLVRDFLGRFVFSAVLFLIAYKVLVNAMGHAGARWDHQLAGAALLGIFAGCLVRPGAARMVRTFRLTGHSGPES